MPAERGNFFKETRPFRPQDIIAVARTGHVRPVRREGFNSSIREQEREQQAHFLTKGWLHSEVARIRSEPIPAGETPWYHLSGTGFWVKQQVSQLLRNTVEVGRDAYPAVLDLELAKVKVDVEKFEEEYLQQMASLKWNLSWDERNGQQRIICPDYGNALWESTTSKDERHGVVHETLFGDSAKGTIGVEGWLREAPGNSFAIIVSPRGWSGLHDADGKNIRYPETQVYAIQKKDDGSLQAYTFRYDADIYQNEALQRKLGLNVEDTGHQLDRIKNTVTNVAFITPEDANRIEQEGGKAIRGFGDLVDVMEEVVGTEVAYGEGGVVKTFADIRDFLAHPEKYSRRHPLTEKLISRFQDYARDRLAQEGSRQEIEHDLQIALALTPLHLNRLYREDEHGPTYMYSGNNLQGIISRDPSLDRLVRYAVKGINYQQERDDLRTRPGCAGGGEKSKVTSMGSSRNGESTSGTEDYDYDHEGDCVSCHNEPDKKPRMLGPCDICAPCDAKMGGKGGK